MSSSWPVRFSVYGAGDAAPSFASLGSFIQQQLTTLSRVATNRTVAAVAQLDAQAGSCYRWMMDPAGRTQPEPFTDEMNTGDPVELLDFFKWAEEVAPSKTDALVLSGHGLAWQDDVVQDAWGRPGRGIGVGTRVPTSLRKPVSRLSVQSRQQRAILMDGGIAGGAKDFLTNIELGVALDNIRQVKRQKLGVLVFDACLMSSAEVLLELVNSVQTTVGGVDEISGSGFNHAGAAAFLTGKGENIDAATVASAFPKTFSPKDDTDSCVAVNLGVPGFLNAVNSFATFSQRLATWLGSGEQARKLVEDALLHGSAKHLAYRGSVADLLMLRKGFAQPSVPAEVLAPLDTCIRTFADDCIIGKSLGSRYSDFLGVSVYSPALKDDYQVNRAEYSRLQFNNLTRWSAVLDRVYLL
jgi:hypothetical protein